MSLSYIPTTVTVIPQVGALNEFRADLQKASDEVRETVKEINTSLKKIQSGTVNIVSPQVAKNIRGATGALNSFSGRLDGALKSVSSFGRGFDATNNHITRVGRSIEGAGRQIRTFGYDMNRLGMGLLANITLPLILLGVSSVKAFSKFEAGLKKVETLVGVNEKVVKRWGDAILANAASLGVAPVELADGLFYAASGFGELAAQSDVMGVLEASAKGSAIGLGEMGDIARTVTAMMNAYRSSNLGAVESLDLLVKATREGNFEIDKLAGATGKVLGTASALGIGADEVLGFIAAYTRFGVEPTVAVTSLNTALTNLLKPSGVAEKTLAKYNLTIKDVQESLSGTNGLTRTLVSMQQQMEQSDFIELFNLRSLRGVLAVSGKDFAGEYIRIIESMKNANGVLDESFLKTLDTVQWKWASFLASMEASQIGFVNAIEPSIKSILDRMREMADTFNSFVLENAATVNLMFRILAGAALAGPVLIIFARFSQILSLTAMTLGFFVKGLGLVVGKLLNLGVVLGRMVLVPLVGFLRVLNFIGGALFFLTSTAINLFVSALSGAFALVVPLATSIGTVLVTAISSAITHFSIFTAQLLGFSTATAARVVLAINGIALSLGGVLVQGIGAIVGLFATFLGTAIALAGPLVVVGSLLLAAVGAGVALFNKLKEVGAGIKESFIKYTADARVHGTNMMAEFSNGIIDGLVYLIESLTAVARVLTAWLKPSSPPKIAPYIDIWGRDTMGEWLKGFTTADFSVLKKVTSQIKTFLKSVIDDVEGVAGQKTIAEILLGTREQIGKGLSEIRELGNVTAETFKNIFRAIGHTTPELEEYIRATFAAAKAATALKNAQQNLEEINKRYADSLSPISARLKEIGDRRQDIEDKSRVKELRGALEDSSMPDEIRELILLDLEQISLESEKRDLELSRDAELSVAEKQLAIAEKNSAMAEERLGVSQEILGFLSDTVDLLKETLEAIKDGALSAGRAGTGSSVGSLGELALGNVDVSSFIGDTDIGEDIESVTETINDALGEWDKKLKLLTDSVGELGSAWSGVFDAASEKVTGWWTKTIQPAWAGFLEWWNTYVQPTVVAIGEEGERTWGNLQRVVLDMTSLMSSDISAIKTNLIEFGIFLSEEMPTAIKAFSDFINGDYTLAMARGEEASIGLLEPTERMREMFGPLAGLATELGTNLGLLGDDTEKSGEKAVAFSDFLGDVKKAIAWVELKTRRLRGYWRQYYNPTLVVLNSLVDKVRHRFFLLGTAGERVGNILRTVRGIIYVLTYGVLTVFRNLLEDVGEVLMAVGSYLNEHLNPYINDAIIATENWVAEKVLPFLLELLGGIDEVITTIGKFIRDVFNNAVFIAAQKIDSLNKFLESMVGWLTDVEAWLGKVLAQLLELSGFKGSVPDWIKDRQDGGKPDDPGDPGDPYVPGSVLTSAPTTSGLSSTPLYGISAVGGFSELQGASASESFLDNVYSDMGFVNPTTSSAYNKARKAVRHGGKGVVAVSVSPGATIVTAGGVSIQFGDVNIYDEMDMAVFQEQVRSTVMKAMR